MPPIYTVLGSILLAVCLGCAPAPVKPADASVLASDASGVSADIGHERQSIAQANAQIEKLAFDIQPTCPAESGKILQQTGIIGSAAERLKSMAADLSALQKKLLDQQTAWTKAAGDYELKIKALETIISDLQNRAKQLFYWLCVVGIFLGVVICIGCMIFYSQLATVLPFARYGVFAGPILSLFCLALLFFAKPLAIAGLCVLILLLVAGLIIGVTLLKRMLLSNVNGIQSAKEVIPAAAKEALTDALYAAQRVAGTGTAMDLLRGKVTK